ncbi:MAG TPA: hypothetical protein VLE95_02605 [Chlamydiales bacterium]|nr:hypothetical protein [Chlamydiales bacterium]
MRPFLLLEVLLALSLVILCAIPLILQPIRAYQSEIVLLEEIERDRLADWTFSEIEELMLKNAIPFEKIPKHHLTTGPFSLNPITIQLPGRTPKKIDRSYTLFGKGEKQGMEEEHYRMVYVKIQFKPELSKKPKIYTYRIAVKQVTI